MKRNHVFIYLLIIVVFLSCQTTKNVKEADYYKKGNIYGPYGKHMDGERLIEILADMDPSGITRAVFETRWAEPETEYKFKKFEGESALEGFTAFYTGQMSNNGPVYTWGYKKVTINSLKELIAVAGFKKPVYVSVEGKTIPLTAVMNEDGSISSGIGVKTDDYFYVCTDTIDEADIWYYYNRYSNSLRNKGFELGAISVVVAECSYAQADANLLLIKDIARITKSIEVTEKDITEKEYDEMLANLTQDKLDMLNDALKKKVQIQNDLSDALGASVGAIIAAGADFALQLADDVLKIAKWSNPMSPNPGAIANYFIKLYGNDEQARKYGKVAADNAGKNIKKGQAKMKKSQEILKKQKAILKLIAGK